MSMFKKGSFKAPKTKKKSNAMRNIGFYLVVGGLLVVSFIGLQMETAKYKKEVSVVALKTEIGAKIIEPSDIKALKIPQKAYNPEMILWADREDPEKGVINKYPSMQIRRDTPIYSDMITDKPPIRYQYLYELAPNEELLTFSYDNLKAAGRIPRPGDRFRIRGSYKLEDDEIEALKASNVEGVTGPAQDVKDEEGNVVIAGAQEGSKIVGKVRTDIIFDVVTVVDMLNEKGDSIFEIIRELEALPKAKQEELASTDSIKQSLTPRSLLLIVKSSQVSKYVEFDANKDVEYTLTLLTRDKSLMEDDIRTGTSIIDSIDSKSGTKSTPKGADN